MKTTIEMPDDLFRRAKAVAALQGLSMKDWLTNLLRREVGAGTTAPAADQDRKQEADAFIQELNRLAADISAHWQGPQDAVAAIREQRRDLGA
jgi:predicted lipoprotein